MAAKKRMRKIAADFKAERGCENCGVGDPRVLDLHHRDVDSKIMAVSQMIYRYSVVKVRAEMDKCRVLCANCHRIEHAEGDETPRSDVTAQVAAAGFFRAS